MDEWKKGWQFYVLLFSGLQAVQLPHISCRIVKDLLDLERRIKRDIIQNVNLICQTLNDFYNWE